MEPKEFQSELLHLQGAGESLDHPTVGEFATLSKSVGTWHPSAKKVVIPQAPNNLIRTGGGKKLCWHTTEGGSIEGAESAYRAAGVVPHFTIALVKGKRVLHQHLPLEVSASALRHPVGTPATNTANCIQVEIVGLAENSAKFPKKLYHYLHLLAEFCNHHFDVPMTEHVSWKEPERIRDFVSYSGHCGHEHVPFNDHSDPGKGFHIGYVLKDIK